MQHVLHEPTRARKVLLREPKSAVFVEILHLRFQVSEDVPVSLSFRGKGHALKVAYDSSVELVLAAAREYFNSSTTLKDPCMGLAR